MGQGGFNHGRSPRPQDHYLSEAEALEPSWPGHRIDLALRQIPLARQARHALARGAKWLHGLDGLVNRRSSGYGLIPAGSGNDSWMLVLVGIGQ